MAGVINTGSHPKALWPGVNSWWGTTYNDWPEEWSRLVDTFNSSQNYEEDVQLVGFGLVPSKGEGAGITYDSEIQGPVTRYTHVEYAMGYIVTKTEQEDNLYVQVSKRRAAHLARSFRLTKENVVANIYNRAFNASYTGGDGVSLLNTAHPNTSGGTWQNKQTVDADLSQTALEDMLTLISKTKDDRSLHISLMPRSLIVPADEWWNANRILKTALTPGSNNNDINVLKATNALPEGIVMNHYLTSTKNWFVRTNAMDGLKLFQRVPIGFEQDNDFDTYNLKAKSRERYSTGWTDPRALFGSNAP